MSVVVYHYASGIIIRDTDYQEPIGTWEPKGDEIVVLIQKDQPPIGPAPASVAVELSSRYKENNIVYPQITPRGTTVLHLISREVVNSLVDRKTMPAGITIPQAVYPKTGQPGIWVDQVGDICCMAVVWGGACTGLIVSSLPLKAHDVFAAIANYYSHSGTAPMIHVKSTISDQLPELPPSLKWDRFIQSPLFTQADNLEAITAQVMTPRSLLQQARKAAKKRVLAGGVAAAVAFVAVSVMGTFVENSKAELDKTTKDIEDFRKRSAEHEALLRAMEAGMSQAGPPENPHIGVDDIASAVGSSSGTLAELHMKNGTTMVRWIQ